MARYTITGNLLAEPEVRDANGKDVINIRIAENLGYPGKDGYVQTGSKIYDISVWEGHPLFDNILDSALPAGTQVVAVVGDREHGVRVYETKKDDAPDLGLEGVAAVFTVDLFELAASTRFATVEVTKNKRKSNARQRDEDEKPARGRSSRSRRDDDDGDEKPARSSRTSRAKDDDADDDKPARSSRSRNDDGGDEDDKPARRSGSASRGRSSRGRSSSDADF